MGDEDTLGGGLGLAESDGEQGEDTDATGPARAGEPASWAAGPAGPACAGDPASWAAEAAGPAGARDPACWATATARPASVGEPACWAAGTAGERGSPGDEGGDARLER